MGCDIHMVYEEKYDTEWVGVHAYPHLNTPAFGGGLPEPMIRGAWPRITERHYELFGKLAGVREDGPEPLGVPEDVSQLARVMIAGWDGDGHSHSYLSLDEFARRYARCERVVTEAAADRLRGGDGFHNIKIICAGGVDVDDNEREARIVFWFDN
jgi:hypothetical protein